MPNKTVITIIELENGVFDISAESFPPTEDNKTVAISEAIRNFILESAEFEDLGEDDEEDVFK